MGTGPAPMRSHSHTTSTKADGFRRFEVITGVGRRRRWTDEEKARIVPVLLAEDSPAPAEAAGRMEIALGSVVVRVGADVDGLALRRVLEVVRSLA